MVWGRTTTYTVAAAAAKDDEQQEQEREEQASEQVGLLCDYWRLKWRRTIIFSLFVHSITIIAVLCQFISSPPLSLSRAPHFHLADNRAVLSLPVVPDFSRVLFALV